MRRKQQQGFTLVEVLAVVVIISVISVLLFSILNSSVSTHQKQTTKNRNLQDTSYTLKLITKDFRKARDFNDDTDTFILDPDDRGKDQTYTLSNNTITRNEEIIATNINDFELTKKVDTNPNNPVVLIIKIVDTSNKEINAELASRIIKN